MSTYEGELREPPAAQDNHPTSEREGGEQPTTFASLGVTPAICQALASCRFRTPTPVQQAVIPAGLQGLDLSVQAKSGTGKTIAFGVIAMSKVQPNIGTPQCLILCHTRELVQQSADVIRTLCTRMGNKQGEHILDAGVVLGNRSLTECCQVLTRPCQILCGTAGRVEQLITKGKLPVARFRTVIIDEADLLLSDTMLLSVVAVVDSLPEEKQVLAFSATWTQGISIAFPIPSHDVYVSLCVCISFRRRRRRKKEESTMFGTLLFLFLGCLFRCRIIHPGGRTHVGSVSNRVDG